MKIIKKIIFTPIVFVVAIYILRIEKKKHDDKYPLFKLTTTQFIYIYNKNIEKILLEIVKKNTIHFIICGMIFWTIIIKLFL